MSEKVLIVDDSATVARDFPAAAEEADFQPLLRKSAAKARELLRADNAANAGRATVLIIDDSATYPNSVAGALGGEGYEMVLARSGEEALDLLAARPVDCILLDLLMSGMAGKEACRRIKSIPAWRGTPLILLTPPEDRAAMLEGLGVGADDCIFKSTEVEVIKARVRAQIRRKQLEDENRRVHEELLRNEFAAAEARAGKVLAETSAALASELERKNKELEAFSYSVSHDLRAPLRAIDGFSKALAEDCSDKLDENGLSYLSRVRAATQRMAELIDDMLQLSRVARLDMSRRRIDLSAFAREIADELKRQDEGRQVEVEIADGLFAEADARLLRLVLKNLIGNAWKFTRSAELPKIVFGATRDAEPVYFVSDNGAGFDMRYVDKLFRPFQRLHTEEQYPGTGIGLAMIQRVIDRHRGRVWAEGEVGRGATFKFTLPKAKTPALAA